MRAAWLTVRSSAREHVSIPFTGMISDPRGEHDI